MASGRLILRATVGALMTGHGLQKLRGSFGGPGLTGTEHMMRSLELHPARAQAMAGALSETIGGGLTAAGLLSPLGPAMVTGVMAVAIKKVHLKNGLWATAGGFEYPLTMMAAAFAVATEGPGPLSLDGLFGKRREGLHWGIIQLALGVGAAAASLAAAQRMAPPAEAPAGPGEAASGPSTGNGSAAPGEQSSSQGEQTSPEAIS